MMDEAKLIEKLRLIEALFARAPELCPLMFVHAWGAVSGQNGGT